MSAARLRAERGLLVAAGALLAAFLVLPLAALVLASTPAEVLGGLAHPLSLAALRLSLLTSLASVALTVALGTPLSWLLSQARGRWAGVLETVVRLPLVVPPAVAGVALLLAFGRRGLLAGWLIPDGRSLAFTTAAVVLAQVFVAAPLYVQAGTSAFRRVDARLLLVARSCGATPLRVFFRVAVPLSAPGLLAGAAMAWARALGEFGATLMFAGNLEGHTQTLPLAIYTALEADARAAQALSVLLILVALGLLLLVRVLTVRGAHEGDA